MLNLTIRLCLKGLGGGADKATARDQQDIETGNIDGSEKSDYKNKHTLESDEEEDEKYDRLDIEQIDGKFSTVYSDILTVTFANHF